MRVSILRPKWESRTDPRYGGLAKIAMRGAKNDFHQRSRTSTGAMSDVPEMHEYADRCGKTPEFGCEITAQIWWLDVVWCGNFLVFGLLEPHCCWESHVLCVHSSGSKVLLDHRGSHHDSHHQPINKYIYISQSSVLLFSVPIVIFCFL